MNRRTVILWALGVGQLLAAAIGFAVREWASNDWIEMAGEVVFISQFYLAGIWVAHGRRSFPWRLVAVGTLLTCLTWLEGSAVRYLDEILFVFSPGVPTTIVVLLLLRVFGSRVHPHGGELRPGNPGNLQFSIRSVLEWTAMCAILLSLASLVHPGFARISDLGWQDLLDLFIPIHLLFTGLCIAVMAIILGMRRAWIGLALLIPAVLVLFALLGWRIRSQVVEFIWVGACAMAWFTISFVPLRLLGYRFGRHRTIDSDATAPRSVA